MRQIRGSSMLIVAFHILFIFFASLNLADADGDVCEPTRCKRNGPAISFPFRLRDGQPRHCGYPGFELSCTPNKKHTVLELPLSVKLFVKHINYTSQQLHVYDPLACLARQLPNLNISASPFEFVTMTTDYSLDSFSFFNCSSGEREYYGSILPCLSTHGYQVQAYSDNYTTLMGLLPLSSCKKMCDTPPVPRDIIQSRKHDFYLKWSQPMCAKCAAQGRGCKLLDRNSNSTSETSALTQCYYIPNQTRGNLMASH